MDEIAPIETKKISSKKVNQWITLWIKVSTQTAYELYKRAKKNPIYFFEYKNYKKILRVIRKAKNGYYNTIFTEPGTDTRKIWGILNEVIDQKQCRKKIPNNFMVGNNKLTQPSDIANAFNDYFASIGTEMAEAQPDVKGFDEYLTQATSRFQLKRVTVDDVEKILYNQQPKVSCGLVTLNNKIVKTCHNALKKPMTMLINKSIEEGKVLLILKKARIIPLYKKGPSNICGNYRPVSLLPSLSKILEKAICHQLRFYLD